MRWWLLAAGFLLALVAGAAEAPALMKAGPGVSGRGLNVRLGPATTTGLPGDTVAFTAWWGLRAYSSAQCTGSTNAVRLRRASDNAEANINIQADCALNLSLASSHCAATTCSVTVFYDQTAGNRCNSLACDLIQTTPANQPAFTFNCSGVLPCIRATGAATMVLAGANTFAPATGVMSLWTVGGRSTGTASCGLVRSNGGASGRIVTSGVSNVLQLGSVSGSVVSAVDIGTGLNTAIGVTNAAASQLNVNGTVVTGTVTHAGSAAAVPAGVFGAAATTCQETEAGWVDNVALTSPQQAALTAGARSYYGTP